MSLVMEAAYWKTSAQKVQEMELKYQQILCKLSEQEQKDLNEVIEFICHERQSWDVFNNDTSGT